MSDERRSPAGVIRAMVAAFETGVVADVIDQTYVDHQGLPHLRPIRGKDGFAHVVEVARAGYSSLSVKIADLIEGDDRAAARLVWSGERENGVTVRRETLEIVRVRDGYAVEHWGGVAAAASS